MTDPTEFYQIMYAMVKAWPATYPNPESHEYVAKRPNTFAVLRSMSDLEADNLSRSVEAAKNPYLFVRGYTDNAARSGLKIEYPLVGLAEDTMTFFNPVNAGVKKQRHKINFFLIDQLPYPGTSYSDTYSMHRTIEEVGRDLREMALSLLTSLRRWEKVTFSAGPYTDGWHDVVWLKAHGDPAAVWESDETMGEVLTGMGEVDGDLIYTTGTDNTAMLITNLLIETDLCPLPVEFNYIYSGGSLLSPADRWVNDK